ncbi:MAG: transcriptional regulator [Candidatus Tectomicrobia bacterium]|uniref:Transcriptional regulator n=1 Tax=Tectimicrobiota bacterium TaxID=2528274 RepID=A0A933LQW4_UNCTE|nr:transcriptional regulator [Candidatus Tectomicrobia bacterium]
MSEKEPSPLSHEGEEQTIRQRIISILSDVPISAREISGRAHISEKEVYHHLNHIYRSLSKALSRLTVKPAECSKCGFVFKKRDRLKKPGRCPLCHSSFIEAPRFSLEKHP